MPQGAFAGVMNVNILCDEISPDTCRLVDINTGEKLDASRFRENLGDIGKGYTEILRRLKSVTDLY